MNWRLLSLLSLFAFSMATGCYKDNEEDLYGTDVSCDTSAVSYANDVAPILQSFCLACHGETTYNSLASGVNLDGYDNFKIYAEAGIVKSAITHDGNASFMPKNSGKLSDCNIAIITKWINDGTQNN